MATNMHQGQIQAFYRVYAEAEKDEALRFGYWDFVHLIGKGHLICGVVEDVKGDAVALFGVELMIRPIVHLSFVFFVGKMSVGVFEAMFLWCWNACQHYKIQQVNAWRPAAVRIVGKDGWRKILQQRGIAIDADGYIREDQKAVRDGLLKWFV